MFRLPVFPAKDQSLCSGELLFVCSQDKQIDQEPKKTKTVAAADLVNPAHPPPIVEWQEGVSLSPLCHHNLWG